LACLVSPADPSRQGSKKPGFLKAQPSGFFCVLLGFWVLLGLFGQAGKIGKIVQKLSNLNFKSSKNNKNISLLVAYKV